MRTIVAVLSLLAAQWPLYPDRSAPRTPDGKINLAAPASRLADGRLDLQGVWMANPGGDPGTPAGRPPLARFGNTAAGFKDDLPFQPWARELQKKRSAEFSKDNPDGLCLPESTLQLHLDPQPFKIVQTPKVIYIIYETNYGIRTIYMDGRPLPAQGVPQPYWYGYSVGRWEGDTLVVETNNLRGAETSPNDGWLDVRGSPYSEQAKFTERIRRPAYGKLEIDITLDDPKAYTKPFTLRVNQQISPDEEIIEFICNENQQFRRRVKVD